MPGLAKKLLIFAAVDGLVLQPYAPGHRGTNNGGSALQIEYRTRRILSFPLSTCSLHRDDPCLESHGIIGR